MADDNRKMTRLTIAELKDLLREKNASTVGNKAELIARLTHIDPELIENMDRSEIVPHDNQDEQDEVLYQIEREGIVRRNEREAAIREVERSHESIRFCTTRIRVVTPRKRCP